MPVFITIFFIGLAALGMALVLGGWRGRLVGDHPSCRRCRFDLVGSPDDAPRCPECGADLKTTRAVQLGQRRRRPIMISCGALAMALAGAWFGLLASGVLAKVDWNQYKPTWWLAIDAQSPDAASLPPVLTELLARLDRGDLSNERIHSLANVALDNVEPMGKAWPSQWDRILQHAWARDDLDEATKLRYAHNLFQPEVFLQPAALDGTPAVFLAFEFEHVRRSATQCYYQYRVTSLKSDSVDVSVPEKNALGTGFSDSPSQILTPVMTLGDSGEHRIDATITWRFFVGSPPRGADSPPPVEVVWETTHALMGIGNESDRPVLQLLTDDASRRALIEAISVSIFAVRGMEDRPINGAGMLSLQESPIEVQAIPEFRVGDRYISRRSILLRNPIRPGRTASSAGADVTLKVPDESMTSLDLVLTPFWSINPAFRREPTDPIRFWYGELNLPNIPVRWFDDADDARIPASIRTLLKERQ